MGNARGLKNNPSSKGRWDDYTKILPEDPYMEEMGEGARVWVVYNKESERKDTEMITGWKDTLDNLLIFAGLFSAVVATFVTQTSQSLQPDYTQVTASLLTELVGIQRAIAAGGNLSSIPPSSLTYDSTFEPDSGNVLLNGLWLISLGLTLYTALISGFVKQWLHYYLSDVTGSPHHRACIRQYRFSGLFKWFVPLIIEMLPTLLHVSLLLFSIGLIVFSHLLMGTGAVTWAIGVLTCFAFVSYVLANSGPLMSPQCPYKASFSGMVITLLEVYRMIKQGVLQILQFRIKSRIVSTDLEGPNGIKIAVFRESPDDGSFDGSEGNGDRHRSLAASVGSQTVDELTGSGISDVSGSHYISRRSPRELLLSLGKRSKMTTAEAKAIEQKRNSLEIKIISRLASHSTNPQVASIALQSLSALHGTMRENDDFEIEFPHNFWKSIRKSFRDCFRDGVLHSGISHGDCERFARAVLLKYFYDPVEEVGRLCKRSARVQTDDDDFESSVQISDESNPKMDPHDISLLRHLCSSGGSDIRFTALTMLMVNLGIFHDVDSITSSLSSMLAHVSSTSESSELHDWVLYQVKTVIESPHRWKPLTANDSDGYCLDLIKSLSANKKPSFQEEMKIRYLYAELIHHDKDGHLPKRMELSRCLFLIIPKLAMTVFSAQTPKIDCLLQFLSRFLPCVHPGRRYLTRLAFWNEDVHPGGRYFARLTFWIKDVQIDTSYSAHTSRPECRKDSSYRSQSWNEPTTPSLDVLSDLVMVLHKLIRAIPLEQENLHWGLDDIDVRINVVLRLCLLLFEQSVTLPDEHRDTLAASVCWLLGLCSRYKAEMMTESMQSMLRSFFAAGDNGPDGTQALKCFFSSSVCFSGDYAGIPEAAIKAVLPDWNKFQQWRDYSVEWLEQFDALFRYFLRLRTGNQLHKTWNPEDFDRAYADRWSTLFTLINIASSVPWSDESKSLWKEKINDWYHLLRSQSNDNTQPNTPERSGVHDINSSADLGGGRPYDPYPWQESLGGMVGPELSRWHTDNFDADSFKSAFRVLLILRYNLGAERGSIITIGDDNDLVIYLSSLRYFELCLSHRQSNVRAEALKVCCEYLKNTPTPGLPASIADIIFDSMRTVRKESDTWSLPKTLTLLFELFVHQDPRETGDHFKIPYSTAFNDRHRTLKDLISLAAYAHHIYARDPEWGVLFYRWKRILSEMRDQSVMSGSVGIEEDSILKELISLISDNFDLHVTTRNQGDDSLGDLSGYRPRGINTDLRPSSRVRDVLRNISQLPRRIIYGLIDLARHGTSSPTFPPDPGEEFVEPDPLNKEAV